MSSYLTSRPLVWLVVAVFVVLAALAAVIQSRHAEEPVVFAPLGPGGTDPLFSDLARCRTVTSDDAAGLDACRRIWAENRLRFFGRATAPQWPAPGAPDAPVGVAKRQDRSPSHEIDHGRVW